MPDSGGEAAPGHRLDGARVAALQRLGRSTSLPAQRRLMLVEELAGDVDGLAARLEARGTPPAEARQRALELLAPSPEAVRELERLHGGGRGRGQMDDPAGSGPGRGMRPGARTWRDRILPQGPHGIVPALAVGALLPWALPAGARSAAAPMALAAGIAVWTAAPLIRQGWLAAGEDPPAWRRSMRLHLASLVVMWAGTLLGGAQVIHGGMGSWVATAPGPDSGAAGGLTALLHPLLVLCVLATALTLAAAIHLTLLVPRVAGSLRARDALEELIQVLLGRRR